ncbi:hypothetical protein NCER_101995 [Vairimorpha ceranae BRL01]|uniref:Uncharacterized protein n=2 Tax=Vairimorpha ceranae TaxID=40302 RepID=C4VB65_VAIC1|nr:hypothetical protein AAJ76_1900041804 [Vairimorpha ceranae]EEQ81536.1 hypothetical protein NCER_101995 [Vairimorpha ceranae BRL01]KAF5139723.1 hypothetical protein G9O61_00g021060 [Vairimorpha ceranae]KKO75510.1 hypothetical protein AAJ76_1900041804 [Vairimorpha ceranae]
MSKKVTVNSIESLISVICRVLPPSSKEDLKVINKLKLFLENNTTIEKDTKKTELTDILFNKTLDISYMRKDMCKEVQEEYKNWIENAMKLLACHEEENLQINDKYKDSVSTNDLEDIKKLNEECLLLLNRMNNMLVEHKNIVNSGKGIVKYFRSL